jgi:response regulator RpfG family c-di-GMP phosphodiesterase
MKVADLPQNEESRLRALHSCEILDTVAERGFDEIIELACRIFRKPIALVTLIDEDRQWFKAKAGINMCETGRAEAFCSHAILERDVIVVPDAREDNRFHDNPLVTQPPYIRFYAGAPLIDSEGHALGTFCLIDTEPADLSEQEQHTLTLLAGQVMDQIRQRNASRDARQYQTELEQHRTYLEQQVHKRTEQVVRSREEVVHCLGRAAEYRDDDTGHHVRRVSRYTRLMCEQLGLSASQCETISLAATLHDVGKIGIPDSILLKPGKLSQREFCIMQHHAVCGSEMIKGMDDDERQTIQRHCDIGSSIIGTPDFELLQVAARIALTHHERFDGSGYPAGLVGEDIPIEGRIVAVADVFDALTSVRPYKPGFSYDNSCSILKEERGSHFDPHVLDAFFARLDEIIETGDRWSEQEPRETEDAA